MAGPKRLATIWRGIRAGRPPMRAGRSPDEVILSMVEEPFSGPDETRRRLRDLLAAFEASDDRRAVFLTIYEGVTSAVVDRVDRGGFEDPEWVARYLVSFANLYRRAVYEYEAGNLERLPDPWQLSFEVAGAPESLVVQDALLGVNAHINYDLAFALEDVGVSRDRARKYADHVAVTDVIASVIDDAQVALAEEYAPGIDVIDRALGRVDEGITVFTIDQCRDSAWRNAVALSSRFRLRRRFARWITDVTATGVAHLLLGVRPGTSRHEILQGIERGDPDGEDSFEGHRRAEDTLDEDFPDEDSPDEDASVGD